jgi:iron complex outermembrane recepter protein
MIPHSLRSRRSALRLSASLIALTCASAAAVAQSTDIGNVDVTAGRGLPIAAPNAVGSAAPPGSAPALAPAQGSLEAFQPGSIISDKVIRDLIPASSDYNETAKYTPGFLSNNSNGLLGDSKSGWRGYADGQFNITFDGIPFGDANDPTHHSAAYFPSSFLGSVVVDRGPGAASQVGYATFGGTLALNSVPLSDTFGGTVTNSFGTFNTLANSISIQTGKIGNSGWRGLFIYSHANTDGAYTLGNVNQDQWLVKADKQVGDFKLTLFGTYGQEQYNNVTSITYPQLLAYGKRYGAVNNNPLSQQYVDYNNSQKATDMEYIKLEGDTWGVHFENTLYTYSYWYPQYQNNGNNQGAEGVSGQVTSLPYTVKYPNPPLGVTSTSLKVPGVNVGDIIGYIKFNNYRAYGDILKVSHDFDAGFASGTLRAGMWAEHVDNGRFQQYIDYTTYRTFASLGLPANAGYKLDLTSRITNFQPFIEYEWRPIENLTITPGFKYESFTRDHNALVNQTTLAVANFSNTYTSALPFLSVKYKFTPELTAYAQASKGFLAPTVSAFYVFNPNGNSIQPQSTTNFQAGVTYKSAKITADADIYQITASNFPLTTTYADGSTVYTNAGTARYSGFEAEGSYNIMNGLSIYGSGAVMSAKYISGTFNNLRVGDAPNFTLAFGAIYDDGKFFGSILQKFTGDYYGSSGQRLATNTTNATLNHVSGYNTLDLVVGVRSSALHDFGVGKSFSAKLGIYNLLDHTNTTEIGGDPTGITSINNTSLTYSFLPGRTIMGSVSIDF